MGIATYKWSCYMNSETFSYFILAYIYVYINNMLFSHMMEYYTDMKMNYVQIHVRKVCHTVKQISQHERIHTFGSNNIMYKNRQA